HDKGHYYVCCGNYIVSQKVEQFSRYLSMLQQLSGTELKQLFKKQLREDPPDGSIGAGLGFIEIARRSTQPIEFEIQPMDHSLSFFTIKAAI
ncbi:MAG: SiaB family protein kinase, partial [Deltaproteobacteria bacterium]|nr:SiaB family protein kinase [Deltaproteobacteria bacterium]